MAVSGVLRLGLFLAPAQRNQGARQRTQAGRTVPLSYNLKAGGFWYQIPDVLEQWIQTAHTAFGERTAWSLFSAFTEVHKLVLKEKPVCPRGRFF